MCTCFHSSTPIYPKMVVQVFMDQIFKLHGMSTSIMSDHDNIFTRKFWLQIFKLQGKQLQLITTQHPQPNGQTKAVRKCLKTYLRCFTSDKQHKWVQHLPLAEGWYNTNYHEATKSMPYEVMYGKIPPSPTSYIDGCSICRKLINSYRTVQP